MAAGSVGVVGGGGLFTFILAMYAVVGVRCTMFLKSRGSYFSPMFSKRRRSSSKIDFFASTDLTISDGFTSCMSNSMNL